ncbi:MAG: glycosyltransferase family 2 protein [Candidatus Omnitrophica bacterium]|nr:glycosyltransferase family 2 protein [Candidatus Omnitrophota bacterium]
MTKQCDIILLSYESPQLLVKCVKSILESTRVRSRLIIVDNASRDPEVRNYLVSLSGNDTVSVEKVFSDRNVGFAGGMNKGMRLSTAPFVCLMNNDCVVTNGWLDEMIAIAGRDPAIGIVNPQSSTFGSFPEKGVTLNGHAAILSAKRGMYVELGHAIGFACLIKREVIDKIGMLDEVYRGVCYEDTDFSVRASIAGYISVMAEGAYVLHYEQASRRALAGKREIYARNKSIFESKWGKLLRILYDGDRRRGAPGHGYIEQYETLKKLARKRAMIDMFVPSPHILERDMRFRKHSDISLRRAGIVFQGFAMFWKVLTKKKKYDAVILRKGILWAALSVLSPIHKARVFALRDGDVITCKGIKFGLGDPGVFVEFLRLSS